MPMRRFKLSGRLALPMTALVWLSSCAEMLPPSASFESGEAAYRFSDTGPAGTLAVAAPLSLTASDGTGIRLAEIEARAVVEDPLALTELRLVFDNPEDRTLEGTFSITLPEGAALSRFAMRIGDDWQEGEVVEKKAARAAYEDFLHRKQDPALLEQAAGNQFSARVFPIPPRGRKELIVSYSQEIGPSRPYAIPLRGLPELGRLDVSVAVAGAATSAAEIHQTAFTPPGDFRLDPRLLKGGPGLRSGELVLARVRPVPASQPDPLTSTLILLDTSASRALGFDEQLRLLDRLVRRLAETAGPKTPLTVACYDQAAEPIFDGEAGAFGDKELRRIRERQAFGASNLEQALGWAGERAKARGIKRVLLVSDGVATAGETDRADLAVAALRLKLGGVERLDAVAMGGIRDEALLKKLVTSGLARDGVVADGALDLLVIEHKLTQATRSGVEVKVEGARWSWPARLDGVQAGDEVLVYAEVPEERPVKISVGGVMTPALDLTPVERPLLERSWARAKIAGMVDATENDTRDPAFQQQIVALSTRHRVLSPYTSLLVLETEQDFARFKIDRESLANILTVDRGRIAVASRSPLRGRAPASDQQRPARRDDALAQGASRPVVAPPPPPPPQAAPPPPPVSPPVGNATPRNDAMAARGSMWGEQIGDRFGAGGLGLAGIGEGGGGRGEGIGLGSVGTVGHGASAGSGQGFGAGHGRLGGSHGVKAPQVRAGSATVSGRLPPEVIQRIVRQQFGRLRVCYEAGLRQNPNLAASMSVRFMIQRDGSVANVATAGADHIGASVAACVVRAFYGMAFPAPEGGTVTVVYPFTFAPDGGSVAAQPISPGSWSAAPPPVAPPPEAPAAPRPPPADERRGPRGEPYTGRFKTVMDLLSAGGGKAAIDAAFNWHRQAPGDVMALVALGEALEASGEGKAAARAYGSIIDLFPARADLRRFAGERLERIKGDAGLDAALDTFQKAEEERPDHPESHRLVAFAELRKGDYQRAFGAAVRGVNQRYPAGRFRGVDRILKEDLGLIAAAWIKAEPKRRDEIRAKVENAGGIMEESPSLRFVLNWETDANDVDFHIIDADGHHAFYQNPILPGGGQLYADVTTGYGPECFTIRLPREQRSAFYKLEAHYYSRGPMGYGMGKLEIIDHDGKGGLSFEERPFVVMTDQAFVELGVVKR
jgi:tetratricopeptide (TPR) repeat protein